MDANHLQGIKALEMSLTYFLDLNLFLTQKVGRIPKQTYNKCGYLQVLCNDKIQSIIEWKTKNMLDLNHVNKARHNKICIFLFSYFISCW